MTPPIWRTEEKPFFFFWLVGFIICAHVSNNFSFYVHKIKHQNWMPNELQPITNVTNIRNIHQGFCWATRKPFLFILLVLIRGCWVLFFFFFFAHLRSLAARFFFWCLIFGLFAVLKEIQIQHLGLFFIKCRIFIYPNLFSIFNTIKCNKLNGKGNISTRK